MIHNSSSDPVLIKKISLKIWSLRDEIESRIQEQIDAGESSPEVLEKKIAELQDEYTQRAGGSDGDNVIALNTINNSTPLPADGEDEMANAMAAAIEGGDEDGATGENTEVPAESAAEAQDNVVPLSANSGDANNVISIKVESPNIAEDKISKGKTILSEISMDKMFFFSNRAFTEGRSIVIQFCIPKTFIVNADVIYCRPFNIKSRIISQNNYTHRMLIKFNFLKEGERALLRQFIQSIEPDVQKIVKKAASEDGAGNESGFNELDDLGL